MLSRHAVAFVALLCASALPASKADAQTLGPDQLKFAEEYRKVVALLEGQTMEGGFRMACTATPFEREGKIVRFVSAAHCVADDDREHGRVVLNKGLTWYLTLDEGGAKKTMYRVKLAAVGYQSRQDDFAVIEAEIDEPIALIPFAKKPARVLEPVVNVASPHGYGKQVFTGHVSSDKLDRPAQEGSINWQDAILLQMAVGGGSSGSTVVSLEQKGIVAFLVGHMSGNESMNIVAIPAARFQRFWQLAKAGKYRWYKPEAESDEEIKDCFCKDLPNGQKDCYCREAVPGGKARESKGAKGGHKQSLPDACPAPAPDAEVDIPDGWQDPFELFMLPSLRTLEHRTEPLKLRPLTP